MKTVDTRCVKPHVTWFLRDSFNFEQVLVKRHCWSQKLGWVNQLKAFLNLINTEIWTTFKQTPADHITSNFLKAVFHNFFLVHSWIICPIFYYRYGIFFLPFNSRESIEVLHGKKQISIMLLNNSIFFSPKKLLQWQCSKWKKD